MMCNTTEDVSDWWVEKQKRPTSQQEQRQYQNHPLQNNKLEALIAVPDAGFSGVTKLNKERHQWFSSGSGQAWTVHWMAHQGTWLDPHPVLSAWRPGETGATLQPPRPAADKSVVCGLVLAHSLGSQPCGLLVSNYGYVSCKVFILGPLIWERTSG